MGLPSSARSHGHEPGEQPLLVEREVTGGADAAHVQRGGGDIDLPASALNGVVDDLGHGHAHQLAEAGLMEGSDVDVFHGPSIYILARFGFIADTPVAQMPPKEEDAGGEKDYSH